MKYPIALCSINRLLIVDESFFHNISTFSEQGETLNISNPRRITVTELKGEIIYLNEPYQETTNITDLIALSDTKVPDSELNANDMKTYFGI